MVKIQIENLVVSAIHGATQKEKEKPQNFRIDIELEAENYDVGLTDDLNNTIDYRKVKKIILEIMAGPTVNLIEKLATMMVDQILELDARISTAQISIRKLEIWDNGIPGVTVTKKKRLHRYQLLGRDTP